MRKRNFDRWGEQKTYQNFNAFKNDFVPENGVISVDLGPMFLDAMLKRGSGDTLFVFLNAALSGGPEVELPVFSWVNISGHCAGSRLFISDPTMALSPEIKLAWYLGTRECPVQTLLGDFIEDIFTKLGAKRIVFVGSSGGGFPALLYARHFKNAAAFVNAPATTVLKHHNPRVIGLYESVAMGGGRVADFPGQLDLCVDEASWEATKVVITQNADDRTYIRAHCTPYLKSRGLGWNGKDIVENDLLVFAGEWGTGHVMPPTSFCKDMLSVFDKHRSDGYHDLDLALVHSKFIDASV